MIESVYMDHSTFAPAPNRFEAGVPMVAQSVGLARAVTYLDDLGMDAVHAHETELTAYALKALEQVSGVQIIGPANNVDRGSAISFTVEGIHPHDVGQILDSEGVAVRVGHHCAWPTCRRLGVPATTRISTYIYNDSSDIDVAIAAIETAQRYFGTRV